MTEGDTIHLHARHCRLMKHVHPVPTAPPVASVRRRPDYAAKRAAIDDVEAGTRGAPAP